MADEVADVIDSEKGPARRRPPARAGCPHDGGELIAYPESSFKAGRVFCADCNCSFAGEELVTVGASCVAVTK